VQAQKQNPGQITLEKARLTQARTLAVRRQDWEEVKKIDGEIEALVGPSKPATPEPTSDLLTKVNQRNRRANMEAVRKAEMMEVERKRRERQLALSGVTVPHDPSARLKTVARVFNSAAPSRFVSCFFYSSPDLTGCSKPDLEHQVLWALLRYKHRLQVEAVHQHCPHLLFPLLTKANRLKVQ